MATDIFKKGESVNSFAQRVGFTPAELRALNPNAFRSAGETINLPDAPQAPQQNSPPTQQSNQQTSQQPNQGGSPLGTQIANEAALQERREELTKAGITDFSQFISSPDQDPLGRGRLFFRQPITMTNAAGETRTVATGSDEANRLLKSGFAVGTLVNSSQVDANLLNQEEPINIDSVDKPIDNTADVVNAGAAEYSKQQKKIADELAKNARPEDEQDLFYQKLLDDQANLIGESKSFETIKAEEKAKADLTAQQQELSQKMDEIDIMLAKSVALDASYQAANAEVDLKPQTLSRAQGAKSANYRNYIAQHNMIASDNALLVAEGKAIEGKLSDATQSANDAINLRYQAQQDEKQNNIDMLNLLIPQINKKDAEYANAVKSIKEDELALINEKKDLMTTAVNAGIYDRNVLNQIEKADFNEAMKLIAENVKTSSNGDWKQIGTDVFGNAQYGFVGNGTVTPYSAGDMVTGNQSGYVATSTGATYDMGNYATDPGYTSSLQGILDDIGQMTDWEQMDSYIQSVSPDSQITGEMIAKASEENQVSWESIMAVLQKESTFGTSNVAQNNNNPGGYSNVGTPGTARPESEGGYYTKFDTMQDGINAVAGNLSRRQIQQTEQEQSGGYQPTGNQMLDGLVQGALDNPAVMDSYSSKQKQAVVTTLAQQGIPAPVAPTQAQYDINTFANRLEQSGLIIDELGSQFTDKLDYISGARFFPNFLKSEDRQSFEQAERNFVNALLRRESGAAISPGEFDSAALQYFPQPGDKKDVLENKKINRQIVISGMKNSAGGAYEEISISNPVGDETSETTGTTSSGITYTITK